MFFFKKKLCFFLKFRTMSKRIRLFVESFLGSCQHCILRVQSNNLRENQILKKKFSKQFRTLCEIFSAFLQIFPAGLSQLHTRDPNKTFLIGTFSWKNFKLLNHFRTLSKKFSISCRKNLRQVVKTAFYKSIGTYWGKLVFSWKNCVFLKNFGQRA